MTKVLPEGKAFPNGRQRSCGNNGRGLIGLADFSHLGASPARQAAKPHVNRDQFVPDLERSRFCEQENLRERG
jgi:hypothetical protein